MFNWMMACLSATNRDTQDEIPAFVEYQATGHLEAYVKGMLLLLGWQVGENSNRPDAPPPENLRDIVHHHLFGKPSVKPLLTVALYSNPVRGGTEIVSPHEYCSPVELERLFRPLLAARGDNDDKALFEKLLEARKATWMHMLDFLDKPQEDVIPYDATCARAERLLSLLGKRLAFNDYERLDGNTPERDAATCKLTPEGLIDVIRMKMLPNCEHYRDERAQSYDAKLINVHVPQVLRLLERTLAENKRLREAADTEAEYS